MSNEQEYGDTVESYRLERKLHYLKNRMAVLTVNQRVALALCLQEWMMERPTEKFLAEMERLLNVADT